MSIPVVMVPCVSSESIFEHFGTNYSSYEIFYAYGDSEIIPLRLTDNALQYAKDELEERKQFNNLCDIKLIENQIALMEFFRENGYKNYILIECI